jgi:pimeloyl-ACP methyl ester carboxylesterase
VLLIAGERSLRLFHVITEELSRCLPAGELVTMPAAGHSVHADTPGAYNAVVLRFLLRN